MFSDFKKSLSESAGRILWMQLQDTQQKMARLNPNVCAAALYGFLQKRDLLIPSMDNMTKDGKIKLGRQLQTKARETLDGNVSEGYALWLAGVWLESMHQPGIEAARVCEYLDTTATESGGKTY